MSERASGSPTVDDHPPAASPPRERRAHEVWLVARRELVTRLGTRGFILSTLLLLATLAGSLLLVGPNRTSETTVGLGPATGELGPFLERAVADDGGTLMLRPDVAPATAIDQLRSGELDALVTTTPTGRLEIVVLTRAHPSLETAVRELSEQRVLGSLLTAGGLDPSTVTAAVAAQTPVTRALDPADPEFGGRLGLGLIAAGLILAALIMYGTTLAQGVVEEKGSRVVEILLATIRPWQLMLGKVVGIGITGIAQLGLLVGVGLGVAVATGALSAPPPAEVLGWTAVWFVLGFLLYAVLIAALAATVSRQEDVPAVFQPVVMLLTVPAMAGILLASNDPDGPAFAVLSLFPLFSPILMPMRVALQTVPLWQNTVAVALTLVSVGVAARLAGRIYGNSILRTGSRVGIREALDLKSTSSNDS